jgi:hypothetical protein
MSNYKLITKSLIGLIGLLTLALQSEQFRDWFAPIVLAHPKLAIITVAGAFIASLLHNPAVEQLLESAGLKDREAGFSRLGAMLLIVALIPVVLLCVACPKSSAVHQAAQTANGIATSLANAEQLNESAYRQGLISAEDSRAVSLAVQQAVQVNDQLIAQVRSLKALDTQSAASVLAGIDKLTDSVTALEQQGILHIKNANTRQAFASYIALIRAAIQTARAVVTTNATKAALEWRDEWTWRSPGIHELNWAA